MLLVCQLLSRSGPNEPEHGTNRFTSIGTPGRMTTNNLRPPRGGTEWGGPRSMSQLKKLIAKFVDFR